MALRAASRNAQLRKKACRFGSPAISSGTPKGDKAALFIVRWGCLVRPLDRTLVLERFSPSAAQPRLQILSGKVKTDV